MNNQQTLSQADKIQSLKATEVIRDEYVRNQFITVYNAIWKEGGEAAYERESFYFNSQLRDNQKLRKSTGMSVFFAFIDLAVRGLSLEPGAQAMCYLLPRSYKVGIDEKGKDVWELRCNLTISGYGELVLRAKTGQILHADNPVVVYEGDEFSYGEKNGQKYVNYCCTLPRKSNKIIACFLKITRCDGSIDYSVMTEVDWNRLKGFSERNNTYYDSKTNQYVSKANELYGKEGGQIDEGFLKAKCIKHAFKTYPKIPIGNGTQLESEVIETQEQAQEAFDPYGEMSQPQPIEEKKETFAPAQDMSQGVTVEDNEDDTF